MSALVGRLLMLCGMIILPIGFAYGLFRNDVRTEVQLLFVGGLMFLTGHILARKPQ
jgi:hypothetical protein